MSGVIALAAEFASLVEAFKNVGVSRAYGAAVQIAGEEIIPVALVTFGFGGGASPDDGSSVRPLPSEEEAAAACFRWASMGQARAATWCSGPTP
jgi:hypothetical protein